MITWLRFMEIFCKKSADQDRERERERSNHDVVVDEETKKQISNAAHAVSNATMALQKQSIELQRRADALTSLAYGLRGRKWD